MNVKYNPQAQGIDILAKLVTIFGRLYNLLDMDPSWLSYWYVGSVEETPILSFSRALWFWFCRDMRKMRYKFLIPWP